MFVKWFKEISKKDTDLVGGKNASLGEMIQKLDVPIPPGFAITTKAYDYFLEENKLKEKIESLLEKLDKNKNLEVIGKKIRDYIISGKIPKKLREEIIKNYKELSKKSREVAVRSSATAEDLGEASFAGQQETYLHVKGKEELLKSVKKCMASLFTNRAISYREDKGFDHLDVKLSVGVQVMIKSRASGVMFSMDPDSGHRNFVCINGSWGLGDYIVQGKVNPDEFYVLKPTMTLISKELGEKKIMEVKGKRGVKKKNTPKKLKESFCLEDKEVVKLAKYAKKIEEYYGRPMDIEWAKDEKLWILQARPETVHSQKIDVLKNYVLKEESKVLVKGESIGNKISTGKTKVIKDVENISKFKEDEILVTKETDPDWEPIMKKASAIITDKGSRTSHAAIVSRELGIPAIVGTENATKKLKTGQKVTVDCLGEKGAIWKGFLDYAIRKTNIKDIPKTKTKIFVNVGIPEKAMAQSQLPVDGVGLAREEFIITSIGEHPLAMIKNAKEEFFVEKLAQGIAKIGAAFYPRPVILRFSDFKTNEYAGLKGGEKFEPKENNPMLGWRGASRYTDPLFEPAFRLECKALRKVRKEKKLTNVIPMIPFCRTLGEAKEVLKIMKDEKLKSKVYVMAEIPSNVLLADKFSKYFDGFSIGTNDLTQLTLGVDRDNQKLSEVFDERDPAVKRMVKNLIKEAHKNKKKVGICGDAPSTHKGYAEFLVKEGIDSISVTPDVALKTKVKVAKIEKKLES